ncbi:MAG: penicillin-binding protein 2 [Verrucomicrobiota bacterium]
MSAAGLQQRALVACVVLVTLLSALSFRIILLQLSQNEARQPVERREYFKEYELPAARGHIFDRSGERLTRNREWTKVVADKTHLRDENIAAGALAKALSLSEKEIHRRFPEAEELSGRYLHHLSQGIAPFLGQSAGQVHALFTESPKNDILVARRLEVEVARNLEDYLRENSLRGLRLEKTKRRFYPSPQRLTHVLGYTNAEEVGQAGVEKAMDDWLAGEDGWRRVECDRYGREVAPVEGGFQAPQHGHDVHLSISMGLQNIVERELERAMVEFAAVRASAVLLEPSTGDILALANRPHFDLNERRGNFYNLAVSGHFEPGSTIKILTIAAALDAGVCTLRDVVDCGTGPYRDNRGVLVHDHRYFGKMTVAEVLANSSNIGTYKVGRQLGLRRFRESLLRFGLDQRTGVRLSVEAKGLVRATPNAVEFASMTYGYALHLTPLQLATAVAAIANEGELPRPRLVTEITDLEGRKVQAFPPSVRGRACSPRAAADIRKVLQLAASEEGTGQQAQVAGHAVAGKTGTAWKYDEKIKDYDRTRAVCSFAGFLPAEDPRVVCVVVIDDPQTTEVARSGGSIAAPVFSRIGAQAMQYLNVTPSLPLAEEPGAAVEVTAR